jgi:sterol desaturase/sphingolipid hydroxylase (fatty acid hydroxylase superfamily)
MAFQLFFILIILLMEKKFPRERVNFHFSKIFWFVTNFLILGLIMPPLIHALDFYLGRASKISYNLSDLSLISQFIIFFILSDFLRYISHYAFHKFDWLWVFHSVHHSSEQIDIFASFKHSWIEAFTNILLSCLLVQFFHTSVFVVIAVNMSFLYICFWQHSNINFKKFQIPFIKRLLITPSMHRKHHELTSADKHHNLGFALSIWDQLFKSYSEADAQGNKYGISSSNYPYHSNLRQFFYPFRGPNRGRAR